MRVLRRVLSEMEIGVEHCTEADAAVQKLTRQRFEAVIVECTAPETALAVLKGTRAAPANKRAVTVAILDAHEASNGQPALKDAFAIGAHFVLFKPVSLERARASFRAVRALMKRERRRHARVPIEMPVDLEFEDRRASVRATTVDLGENGMALKLKDRKIPGSMRLRFALPGTNTTFECKGEVAWEGSQVLGIRFCDASAETLDQLKQWIARQLIGSEAEDLGVTCKLTDLSLNACYLQTESPFPVRTRLRMTMKVGGLSLQIEGIVRVMHADAGMGVEFTQRTSAQKARVEQFIQTLVNTTGAVPDLQVRPDAIDNSADVYSAWKLPGDHADPLLSLFRTKSDLSTELFQAELRKQRGIQPEDERRVDRELLAAAP